MNQHETLLDMCKKTVRIAESGPSLSDAEVGALQRIKEALNIAWSTTSLIAAQASKAGNPEAILNSGFANAVADIELPENVAQNPVLAAVENCAISAFASLLENQTEGRFRHPDYTKG